MSRSGKMTFDIFVTNLPSDLGEDLLIEEFSVCGEVQSVVLKDNRAGRGKHAFVRYLTEEAQEMAVVQMNGKIVKERPAYVRKADRKDKSNTTEGSVQNGSAKRQRDGHPNSSNRQPDYVEQAILVTYVVDACTVYAQLAHRDMAEVSASMMTEINQYCPAVPRLLGPPAPNSIYGALFSEDGMWYRCKVLPSTLGIDQQPQVGVHYLDYGNDEVVDSNTLVELPMSLASLPPQAHKLVFRGVTPTAETAEDAKKAVEFLQQVTEGKTVLAHMYCPLQSTSNSTPVELYDGPASLNDLLIQREFAIKLAPSNPMSYQSRSARHVTPLSNGSCPNDTQPLSNSRTRSPITQSCTSPQSGGVRTDATLRHQSNELVCLQADNAYLLNGQNELLGRIAKMNEEARDYLAEFELVKDAATGTLLCLQDLEAKMRTSMQDKTAALLKTFGVVKQTRKLVIIDPHVHDPLESAIALLTQDTGSFVSLQDGVDRNAVGVALDHYSYLRSKFREPEAKDRLSELTAELDKYRVEVYETIQNFVDTVNVLPLEERKMQIESLLFELDGVYHDILTHTDPSLLEATGSRTDNINICMNYKEWKCNKSKQLSSLRATTDDLASQWQEAVKTQLIDSFDLTSDPTSDLPHKSVSPLDELASVFLVAMTTEVAICGQGSDELDIDPELLEKNKEKEGEEDVILRNTVRVLNEELRRELGVIKDLVREEEEDDTMGQELGRWLTERPDVGPLQAVQRAVRALRSKVRHKIADMVDVDEDSDSGNEADRKQMKAELGLARLELQRACIQEDVLLDEIAQLSHHHFPELAHRHPHFNIDNWLSTLGLVKTSRDVQMFDLKPLPDCSSKTIHLSDYDDKPVVIKSFFIPCDKARAVFINEWLLTRRCDRQGLLHADALYTESSLGLVHVQLPYVRMGSLEDAVKKNGRFASKPLTPADVQSILRDVLRGLANIHKKDGIYGAVQPRNILLSSRRRGVLADFDKFLTPTQRAQNSFVSSSGVTFAPPEVKRGHEATHSSDMYSFGALMLWAHYAETTFAVSSDGSLDISGVSLAPPVRDAITGLLAHDQDTRPSAQNLLNGCSYFNTVSEVEEEEEEEEVEDDRDDEDEVIARDDDRDSENADDINSSLTDGIPKEQGEINLANAEMISREFDGTEDENATCEEDEDDSPPSEDVSCEGGGGCDGEMSVAEGYDAVAEGDNAVAMSDNAVAMGEGAVDMGDTVVAKGDIVVAKGDNVVATGDNVVANNEDVVAKVEPRQLQGGSILLKKMVAAVASKDNAPKIPQGSEI